MKKMIAIAVFIAVALAGTSVMAQEPTNGRKLSGSTAPAGGFNVTRFGYELQAGWFVLMVSPVQSSHDVGIVHESDYCLDELCDEEEGGELIIIRINDDTVIEIDPEGRYLIPAAGSRVLFIAP